MTAFLRRYAFPCPLKQSVLLLMIGFCLVSCAQPTSAVVTVRPTAPKPTIVIVEVTVEVTHEVTKEVVVVQEKEVVVERVVEVTRLVPATATPQPAATYTPVPTPTPLPSPTPTPTAQWSSISSMTVTRTLHTATLLDDGRVLLVGGYTGWDIDTATAEIFDPLANTYTLMGSLNSARHHHSATLLPDGRILVVAGYHDSWLSDAEIYDPTTDRWSITQPIFAYSVLHTATRLKDGRVLVIGGNIQSGSPGMDNRVEIFDPTTDSWQEAALHQNTEGGHTATLLTDGRVLIAGGSADPAIYDPVNNIWLSAGELTVSRSEAKAVRLRNGRVLLIGGISSQRDAIYNSVEIYDPASNTWRQVAPLTQARYVNTATLLPDGRVLVTGGAKQPDNSWSDPDAILNSVEIYDPTNDTWSALPPLQHARAGHTATLLPDGRIFLAGGFTTGHAYLDSVEILSLDGR